MMNAAHSALADQWGAAVRESSALLNRLTSPLTARFLGAAATWARRLMMDRTRRLTAEDPTLIVCRHLPSPCSVLMPTWADVMVCTRCTHLIPAPTAADDRLCDCCGRITDVHPVVVGAPPITVLGGLCSKCIEDEVA
jgi:hypothetical protein